MKWFEPYACYFFFILWVWFLCSLMEGINGNEQFRFLIFYHGIRWWKSFPNICKDCVAPCDHKLAITLVSLPYYWPFTSTVILHSQQAANSTAQHLSCTATFWELTKDHQEKNSLKIAHLFQFHTFSWHWFNIICCMFSTLMIYKKFWQIIILVFLFFFLNRVFGFN